MVRAGTHDAIVQLMRAGSSNPGADFFTAVRDGIAEAVKAVARDRETTGRQEAQRSAPVSYDRSGEKSGSHDASDEPPRGDPGSGPVQP